MKIRTGFVSNSSSSSFCLIGTKNNEAVRDALKKEFGITDEEMEDCITVWEKSDFGHGYANGKQFKFIGSERIDRVGLDAEPLLQKMTISEAIKHVAKTFKKAGINISDTEIKFMYGEAGNG